MDLLIEGLTTTVVGMLTVFVILILLSFVLYLLRFIAKDEKKKTSEVVETKKVEVPSIEVKTDDCELIAVITAAIAMSLGTTSDKLRVTSIKKVNNWNQVSRREQQRNII